MLGFSIPYDNKDGKRDFFSFSVERGPLLFAGSRHTSIDDRVCTGLINAFGSLNFTFLTGCAGGVDESFRKALGKSDYAHISIMACAFPDRIRLSQGILPLVVVPEGLPPRAALAKRTLWMTALCRLLVLFPSSPMGKGSSLAFRSAIMGSKPVFIVTKDRPKDSNLYRIFYSSLFGVVEGYWCIPYIYKDTGLCYQIF